LLCPEDCNVGSETITEVHLVHGAAYGCLTLP
jgi:hypothetical protein